ncbi:uncharacterized protein J7T54_000001, partial [Emericellopsis cladophorae]
MLNSLFPLAVLATAVTAKHSSTADNVSACCSKLSETYPDQLVYAGEDRFEDWNDRWAASAELPASCIFRPLTADDVSFAIKTVAKGAGKGNGGKGHGCHDFCPFSIKGGGHTPWPGANNVDRSEERRAGRER